MQMTYLYVGGNKVTRVYCKHDTGVNIFSHKNPVKRPVFLAYLKDT